MTVPDSTAAPAEPARRTLLLAGGLLVLAVLAAYHNTFALPFIFDDRLAIVENASIRQLWPLTDVLTPPQDGSGVSGRPLVNLSFALNHAVSGDAVWSYHALNLLIHAGAGLALFGVVRRTLLRPVFSARVRGAALPLGFAVAALWLLHPLQTESVTSVVQRTESMMGLLYLLTFYGFVRGAEATRPAAWLAFSVAMCLLGMATKEVMVTAPLLVLGYDRAFVAGMVREAWRRRQGYYLALAATWLLLAALLLQAGGARNEAAGFGLGVTPWEYALTQCRALVLYLQLAVWPHPLVLDYGTPVVRDWREVAPQGLLVLGLLAAAGWVWWRRPAVGFSGAAFFVILAPSSSVVPLVGQTMAEHRMYLPLAAVLVLLVVGCHRALGKTAWWFLGAVAVGFAALTVVRNRDYRSELNMWSEVVKNYPQNVRGHLNLANGLAKIPARASEALPHFEEALRRNPDYAQAHYNFAALLATLPGRQAEGIAHYRETLRLRPDHVEAHNNLAVELAKAPGRPAEVLAHLAAALRLRPDYAEAHYNLANTLSEIPGRQAEGLAHYEKALRLRPDYAEAHYNLAALLAKLPGRTGGAMVHYEAALRLKPDYPEAHNNLALLLGALPGRSAEAMAHYEAALRLRPDYAEAHYSLALELAKTPARVAEAIAHYEAALRAQTDFAEAHCNLGAALAPLPGRLPEAIGHFEAAVRIAPAYLLARSNLALAYANAGRLAEAAAQLEALLALDPGHEDARRRLRAIRVLLAR